MMIWLWLKNQGEKKGADRVIADLVSADRVFFRIDSVMELCRPEEGYSRSRIPFVIDAPRFSNSLSIRMQVST